MENMNKELTVPKWVLIVWPKIPQMPQNLSAQIVCPSPKVWDLDEKRLHWASVVHDHDQGYVRNLHSSRLCLQFVYCIFDHELRMDLIVNVLCLDPLLAVLFQNFLFWGALALSLVCIVSLKTILARNTSIWPTFIF